MPAKRSTKRGLGKGIDSLIPTKDGISVEKTVKSGDGVANVKINKVEPNRSQPRKVFDEAALNELADSIKNYGIIQPIVVQKKDDYYEIIAGERRWRAAKLAKLKEVPVVIKDFSEQEIVEIALIENIQREDLNPVEEAQAYKRLLDEYNLKQDELAERVSKNRTTITNSLRLLKLSDKVQKLLISGELSSGHGRCLVSVEDKKKQYELALKIIKEKLSVRETENLVKNLNNKKAVKKTSKDTKDAVIYKEIENQLKDIVGNKVKINNKSNGKGKIEIEYYSVDDLERLIDLFKSMK